MRQCRESLALRLPKTRRRRKRSTLVSLLACNPVAFIQSSVPSLHTTVCIMRFVAIHQAARKWLAQLSHLSERQLHCHFAACSATWLPRLAYK